MFDVAQAVRDALISQAGATTTAEVIDAVQEVIDDAVDVALAATDMDTSVLFLWQLRRFVKVQFEQR